VIVGVPTEVKEGEHRVALTPDGVRELVGHGHRVLVQRDAGAGSSVADAEYERAGAELVSVDDAWAAELVVKVKEPQTTELGYLRPDLTLFTYLHLAAEPEVAEALVASGATGIAYETVQLPDGSLPLLAPMSEVAGRMAAQLAEAGLTVLSGAAYGIDVAAHRGALAGGGATVAVLACGVDRAYPAGNQGVIDHLAQHGLVVSEVPPGCAPTKLRFLSRNRLIAALAAGTVVVEAAVRSGALSTAAWANRLGRVLMGVPGPVTSAPSEGVHELVRRGDAHLVTSAAHVLELVAPVGSFLAPPAAGEGRRHDGLDPHHLQVLDAVPVRTPAPVAAIARTAGLGVRATEVALARLSRLGLVRGGPGGWRLASAATRSREPGADVDAP